MNSDFPGSEQVAQLAVSTGWPEQAIWMAAGALCWIALRLFFWLILPKRKNSDPELHSNKLRAAQAATGLSPEIGNIKLEADVSSRIIAALRKDNKIEAIKIFREATGTSLLDAKNAVEALERNL